MTVATNFQYMEEVKSLDRDDDLSNISCQFWPRLNGMVVYQGSDGPISQEKSQNFSVSSGDRFEFITQSISFSEDDDFLHFYVDARNRVQEQSERNNHGQVHPLLVAGVINEK